MPEQWGLDHASGYDSWDGDDDDEEYQVGVPLTIFRIIVCAIGVLGNVLVIFVIMVLREYKKAVTHWYVLQLAIADSVFLLTIPFKVHEEIHKEWKFSGGMCKAKETIVFLNYYSSVFFLVVMSIDRYIAVCHGLSPMLQKLRTMRAAYVVTAVVWTISLLLCIPIILYSDKRGFNPHCQCGYEFPKPEISAEQKCINDGLGDSNSTLRLCLDVRAELPDEQCIDEAAFNILLTEKLSNMSINWNDSEATSDLNERVHYEEYSMQKFSENNSLNDTDNGSVETASSGQYYYSDDGGDHSDTEIMKSSSSGQNYYDDDGLDSYNKGCSYEQLSPSWFIYLRVNFIVMFIIPFAIMSVCYTLIALRLKQSGEKRKTITVRGNDNGKRSRSKSAASSKAEKDRLRITILCLALVALFVMCWLPFHVVHLLKIKGIPGTTQYCIAIGSWTSIAAYLNSALNPYVYNFVGKKFLNRLRSAAGRINKSVREVTPSFSSSAAVVRYHRRKSSNAATSSNSGTAITRIYTGKGVAETSRAQSSVSEDGSRFIEERKA